MQHWRAYQVGVSYNIIIPKTICSMTVTHEIPTINLSSYLDSKSPPANKASTIEDVKSACSEYGFLQVTGHGVPLTTQRNILDSCKTLFDLPQGQKDTLSLKNNPARRGYERVGEQVLDSQALPDSKEVCPSDPYTILSTGRLTHKCRASTLVVKSLRKTQAS